MGVSAALASPALLLPLSASFQSRPESAKDGVMLLGVKASGGDENGEPPPPECSVLPRKGGKLTSDCAAGAGGRR